MIICILGPTASHKSALASLTASLFNADIINFDAFQIYKELNIGTAKPSKDELKDPKYKMMLLNSNIYPQTELMVIFMLLM